MTAYLAKLHKPYIAPKLIEIAAAMGGLIQRGLIPIGLFGVLGLSGCGIAPFPGDSRQGAWHKQLEHWLERGLGHPVDLGNFQGFGSDGLAFAATTVLPTKQDHSSMAARELFLLPDLSRSLQQRQLVLRIGLKGFRARLIKSKSGEFWVFPKGKGKAPRLSLRLELLDPAHLQLDRGGAWQLHQALLDLDLPNRKLDFYTLIRPNFSARYSKVVLRNHWGVGRNLRLQFALQQLPLTSISPFLPKLFHGQLQGLISGDVQLNRRDGRWQCWGPFQLNRFKFQRNNPLRADNLRFVCEGEQLALAPSQWSWRNWRAEFSGLLRWDGYQKLRLALTARAQRPKLRASALIEGINRNWRLTNFSLDGVNTSSSLVLNQAKGGIGPAHWWLHVPAITWRNSAATVEAGLKAGGSWNNKPILEMFQGNFSIAAVRLPQPLRGSYRWKNNRLHLLANGPFQIQGAWKPQPGLSLNQGAISGSLSSSRLPLKSLSPNQPLHGWFVVNAEVKGTLQKPLLDAQLQVENPGYGPFSSAVSWRGKWQPGLLWMQSPAGFISARLRGSNLQSLNWRQKDGELNLISSGSDYRWVAKRWDLAPWQLRLGRRAPLPLAGALSGAGRVAAGPFKLEGSAAWLQPRLGIWSGSSVQLNGILRNPGFSLQAQLDPGDRSELNLFSKGAIGAQFELQVEGRRLQPAKLWQFQQTFQTPYASSISGKAGDLFGLAISSAGLNLDGQLQQWRQANNQVGKARSLENASRRRSPEALRGVVDLELNLRGPNLNQLNLAAAARGQVWLEGENLDRALQLKPLVATIQGPINQGDGQFSFSGIPLSLLALITPVPPSLRGTVAAQGQWRKGRGDPQIKAELQLDQGRMRDQPLQLERGGIQFLNNEIRFDLALKGGAASSSIDLSGRLPLDPKKEDIELRLSSRNDGLIFLAALLRSNLEWRQGSADLQLLVRGSREKPIANGFMRLRDGEIRIAGQTLTNLQTALFFDFKRLVLEEFNAVIGKGSIEAKGSLPFVSSRDGNRDQEVKISLNNLPIQQANLRLLSDGKLVLSGSLIKPLLGGELSLSNGRFLLGETQLAQPGRKQIPLELRLPETNWQFQEPLVLLGPSVESSSGVALRRAIPAIGIVRLKDLRLNLGPDLRVTAPPVADFSLAGLLTLNGPIGPDIQLSGVVRLPQGRVNVFTSSLRLDNNSPNVAIFTPSLGLIPYLDLALSTRVSDQVRSGERSGLQSGDQLQGSYSNLDRLNLVKVLVRVAGPADRIGDNLEMRSVPPLPRERLVALLGGNSLAGLSGGDAGTALVTILGQTLLTPVVGGFSELLGQRLNVALYPAYLDPYVTNSSRSSTSNRRVPSKLVLGSEVGLDITERLNFSVLAAPNRSDIPPEATLRYQATDNLGVQGSFDQQGRWQSQVQLFFRF
jgi:translocation and assembly module TamB